MPYRTPFLITLYHLNPMELAWHLQVKPGLSRHDRVAAIVPFWELETLPPGWADVLAAMDIILTPSSFIRSAVRRELPDCPLCRLSPDRLLGGAAARSRPVGYGRRTSTVFVTSFDVVSTLERKNPHAVVDAFQLAFEGRTDVQLLLKANSLQVVTYGANLWADLVQRAGGR